MLLLIGFDRKDRGFRRMRWWVENETDKAHQFMKEANCYF